MLNEKEKRLLEVHQGNNNLNTWIQAIEESENPFFLKESAECYNWDDSFELPLAVVKNVHCDKGTSLSLFWLAEGIVWYTGEVQKDDYNDDWSEFCKLISNGLINGIYRDGAVGFTPELSRVTIYKYKKSGVPEALYQPITGTKNP